MYLSAFVHPVPAIGAMLLQQASEASILRTRIFRYLEVLLCSQVSQDEYSNHLLKRGEAEKKQNKIFSFACYAIVTRSVL